MYLFNVFPKSHFFFLLIVWSLLPQVADRWNEECERVIHSKKYSLQSAIVNASKAAYLSKMIEKGNTEVHHFNPDNVSDLVAVEIVDPLPIKLNRLKKTDIETIMIGQRFRS